MCTGSGISELGHLSDMIHINDFSGFDVIYDVIPSMSKYQASVVLMALYIRFAAGAIQFAQNILQGDPESKICVDFEDHPIENHIKSGGSDFDQIRLMGADYVSFSKSVGLEPSDSDVLIRRQDISNSNKSN